MKTDTTEEETPTEIKPETAHHEAVTAEDILPPQTVAEPVTADDLAGALAEAMPEPTESKMIPGNDSAPESAPPPQPSAAPENPFPFEQDPKGRTFDPALHALGDDGKPKRNVKGFFVSKKIGRPSGPSAPREPGERSNIAEAQPGAQNNGPDRFTMAADSYFAFGINVAAAFLSAEVLPESDEQKKLITLPLADVLRKHDAQEMEPELRLVLGCGVYGFAKYQKPTVKERFLKLLGRKPKPAPGSEAAEAP